MKRTSRLPYLTSLVVIILSALCLASCGTEQPADKTAPAISVIYEGVVDVTGGMVVKTAGASLRIGDLEIATWSDDRTAAEMCTVKMEFDGKTIRDGATLDKTGWLVLSVSDEAGNSSSSSVATWIDSNAPQITLAIEEVNVFGGLELTSAGGALFIGENEIARWSDDKTSAEQCTVTATLDGEAISIGTVLDMAGVLKFVITDDAGNVSEESTVTLTDNALNGIDALAGMSFTVDKKYDLTHILSTVNGFSISKVEMILTGKRVTVPDPANFSSDWWGDVSFVITVSRGDGKSEEIVVDGIKINPLEFNAYSIANADNTYIWGYFQYEGTKTRAIEHLASCGVFSTQSVVLEAIANGTSGMDAASVRKMLGKNTIVILSEFVSSKEQSHNYWEEVVAPNARVIESFRVPEYTHGARMANEILAVTEPILTRLNKKIIGPLSTPDPKCIIESLLPYVKEHKGWNFFMSNSTAAGGFLDPSYSRYTYGELLSELMIDENGLREVSSFVEQDNVFFVAGSMGNLRFVTGHEDWLQCTISLNEFLNNQEGWLHFGHEINGFNAIMGADYAGITHGNRKAVFADGYDVPGGSLVPLNELGKSERVWSNFSQITEGGATEPTSQATSSFTAKAYLATCANMLVNPDITQQENHKLLRSVANDGTVLLDGEYHFTTKQMNPGGTLYQFYSKLPETISMSGNYFIPIEHSLHINSVIVGPGIVDENGTEVTKDNYTQMLGKKLFIDPVKLYKYGHKAGDSIEYTEHLCCDSKGSGAQDKASEAYKSIVSKTFTVKIQ